MGAVTSTWRIRAAVRPASSGKASTLDNRHFQWERGSHLRTALYERSGMPDPSAFPSTNPGDRMPHNPGVDFIPHQRLYVDWSPFPTVGDL